MIMMCLLNRESAPPPPVTTPPPSFENLEIIYLSLGAVDVSSESLGSEQTHTYINNSLLMHNLWDIIADYLLCILNCKGIFKNFIPSLLILVEN